MIMEHKILIGLDDIKAVIFECRKCKSQQRILMSNLNETPNSCTQCNSGWIQKDNSYHSYPSRLDNFVKSMKKLLELENSNTVNVKILLEIDERNE